MEQLFELILSKEGFVTAAFACLLFYVLKENSRREGKYEETIAKNQEVILTQAKNFDIVKDMQGDISDLKDVILKGGR